MTTPVTMVESTSHSRRGRAQGLDLSIRSVDRGTRSSTIMEGRAITGNSTSTGEVASSLHIQQLQGRRSISISNFFSNMMNGVSLEDEQVPEEERSVMSFGGNSQRQREEKTDGREKKGRRNKASKKEHKKDRKKPAANSKESSKQTKSSASNSVTNLSETKASSPPLISNDTSLAATPPSPLSRPSLADSMRQSMRSVQMDLMLSEEEEKPNRETPLNMAEESAADVASRSEKHPTKKNSKKTKQKKLSSSLSDHLSNSIRSFTAMTSEGLNDESSVTPSLSDHAKMLAATLAVKEKQRSRDTEHLNQRRSWQSRQEESPDKENWAKESIVADSRFQGDEAFEPFPSDDFTENEVSVDASQSKPRPLLTNHFSIQSIRSLSAITEGLYDESSVTPSLTDNVKTMASTSKEHQRFVLDEHLSQQKRYWTKTLPTTQEETSMSSKESSRKQTSGSRRKKKSSKFKSAQMSSGVSFSVVEYREYNLIVGDNPSCSDWLPLSLDWDHGPEVCIPVDDFERNRELFEQKAPKSTADDEGNDTGCRRWKWHERRQLLISEFGYTEQELRNMEREFAEANGRVRRTSWKLGKAKDWFFFGARRAGSKNHNSIAVPAS